MTTTSKETQGHTPGPWKIDESESQPLAVIQDDENGTGIVEVSLKPTRGEASQTEWADAHLIATAPQTKQERDQLLEAAKAVALAHGHADNIPEWLSATREAIQNAQHEDGD